MKLEQLKQNFENMRGNIGKQYILHSADARIGKKIALGKTGESGTISIITSYMSYGEMDCFLNGYCLGTCLGLG